MHMLKNLLLATLTVLVLVHPAPAADELLTEASVRELIDGFEQAATTHDINKLTDYFANDVDIVLLLPKKVGGGVIRLDLAGYKTLIKEAWANASKYDYTIEDVVIEIDPSGKIAHVYDTTEETLEIDGTSYKTRTDETVVIGIVNNKPKITAVVGKIEMTDNPILKQSP